jgi:hypothetical protein
MCGSADMGKARTWRRHEVPAASWLRAPTPHPAAAGTPHSLQAHGPRHGRQRPARSTVKQLDVSMARATQAAGASVIRATQALSTDSEHAHGPTTRRGLRLVSACSPIAARTANMMPYRPISSKSTSLGSSMMSTVLLNARLWCGVARPCRAASTCGQCRCGGKQLARSLADTSETTHSRTAQLLEEAEQVY